MSKNLRELPSLLPKSLQEYMAWFDIEPEVMCSVLKESYELDIVRGDFFTPNFDDAAICFIKCGMLQGFREFGEDANASISFFTPRHILATEDTLGYNLPSDPETTYQVVEDCSLSIIPGDTVSKFMSSSSQFFKFALDCFTRRHLVYRDWKLAKELIGKKQFLIFSLTGMFDILSRSDMQEIHISAQQLSDMTGTSRQYVTQVISQLIKEGLVEKKYKNFAPKDLSGLKEKIENKELYLSLWGHVIS